MAIDHFQPRAGRAGGLERMASAITAWAERWFPSAYIFAAIAVAVVAVAAIAIGAPVRAVGIAFGDGFWTLIPFTMQMALIAIVGYVVAVSPLASRLIDWLATRPGTARAAVSYVALISLGTSLFNWSISLVFSGLLARALARRADLRMDYRAAGAAAYLGMGATWALGLSSAPAQLQANGASLPPALLNITGVIPFSQTIFLWQSMFIAGVLIVASMLVAYYSAPERDRAVTAQDLGIDLETAAAATAAVPGRPGERLDNSPVLTVVIVLLGAIWIYNEFGTKDPILAISNLNTYNFVFLMLGMLLHWRPRSFLQAVAKSVPSISGMLIQFPLYGGIAYMMTKAGNADGHSLAHLLSEFFVSASTHGTFPVLIGVYSAVLGFFLPSGGGKWIIEAPYVMQAAQDLHVHLGWAVTVYNAAETLPNLINPFWMLPLLGVLGIRARDIVGFTVTHLAVHVPLVLFLLWALASTLTYLPPVMP